MIASFFVFIQINMNEVTCKIRWCNVSESNVCLTRPSMLLTAPQAFPGKARLQPRRSQHPQTRQQERGGGNEKNANLVVEILHLASLMRDQGDQGRGQLWLWRAMDLCREREKERKRRQPLRKEWRSERNVKDCLIEQRSKVGKECNIGLRSGEMRRKKITTQQQGFLIQFSLLLCSVIWSVAKQSEGVVPPACDCRELKACLNLSLC